MEFVQQWLLSVVACALLVSVSAQLCPDGSMRSVVRFTGGLLLLCAMLRPLTTVELPGLAWSGGAYREALAQANIELRGAEENALSDGIAAGLASYIEDKAGSLGAAVRATVTMKTRDGVPVPVSVTLRGAYSEALSGLVERDLGVKKEHQQWIES